MPSHSPLNISSQCYSTSQEFAKGRWFIVPNYTLRRASNQTERSFVYSFSFFMQNTSNQVATQHKAGNYFLTHDWIDQAIEIHAIHAEPPASPSILHTVPLFLLLTYSLIYHHHSQPRGFYWRVGSRLFVAFYPAKTPLRCLPVCLPIPLQPDSHGKLICSGSPSLPTAGGTPTSVDKKSPHSASLTLVTIGSTDPSRVRPPARLRRRERWRRLQATSGL